MADIEDILGRCDTWEESKRTSRLDAAVADCGRFDDAYSDGPFQKMEHKLEGRKGVHDPKALAAAIGRKSLGQAEMTRRSVAGREHSGG